MTLAVASELSSDGDARHGRGDARPAMNSPASPIGSSTSTKRGMM
jgi:hypothetical protein